jgi:hypothetical protein
MERAGVVLIPLFLAFLIPGCASAGRDVPSDARVEQATKSKVQPPGEPKKLEPAQTLSAAEIEKVKSLCPQIEDTDVPALSKAEKLAQSGRALYEKYFVGKIKTGSGDRSILSEALASYNEADELIRMLLVRYPHSNFLSTISCNVRGDLRLLQMEQK